MVENNNKKKTDNVNGENKRTRRIQIEKELKIHVNTVEKTLK